MKKIIVIVVGIALLIAGIVYVTRPPDLMATTESSVDTPKSGAVGQPPEKEE